MNLTTFKEYYLRITKKLFKEQCEAIARAHNVKLSWIKGEYGFYIPNTNRITVGTSGTIATTARIFSHEMGHVFNFRNKKYYKYNRYVGKEYTKRFLKKDSAVKYALRAEIYTDKVGKRLCKKWFPNIKYKGSYKMNKRFYDYMYQKFFGGFFIIVMNLCGF